MGFVVEQAISIFFNTAAVFVSLSTFCNVYYYDYINLYTFYMTSVIIGIIIIIMGIIIAVSCYGKLRMRWKVIVQTQSFNVITGLQF